MIRSRMFDYLDISYAIIHTIVNILNVFSHRFIIFFFFIYTHWYFVEYIENYLNIAFHFLYINSQQQKVHM